MRQTRRKTDPTPLVCRQVSLFGLGAPFLRAAIPTESGERSGFTRRLYADRRRAKARRSPPAVPTAAVRRWRSLPALVLLVSLLTGCAAGARAQLAAADAVETAAASLALALSEYHADLDAADDLREHAAVEAFLSRLKRGENGAAPEQHVAAFVEALRRIYRDRAAARTRRAAARDNLTALNEVAGGLRNLGLKLLAIEHDARDDLAEILRRPRESTVRHQGRKNQ